MTATSIERTASEPDDSEGSSARLDADERFHLLQNRRRRLVLRYLRDADVGPASDDDRVWMRDVAEQVAAWEHDTTVAHLSSTQRQRVYIPLYQNHLPKLDDAGVIDYDQSRGTIHPTPRVDHLARFLDPDPRPGEAHADADGSDEGDDATWHGYYLGASGVAAAMLGGVALSVLPGFAVAAAILALFSTVSLSQYVAGAADADEEAA